MLTCTVLLPVVLALAIGAEATPADRQSWKTPSQRRGDRRALGAILPAVTVPLAPAPAAPVPTTRVAGDFQTFNQGLGGVYAPAVTYANGFWYQSGQRYNSIYDALVGSCNAQADTCMVTGLVVDKLLCWGTVSVELPPKLPHPSPRPPHRRDKLTDSKVSRARATPRSLQMPTPRRLLAPPRQLRRPLKQHPPLRLQYLLPPLQLLRTTPHPLLPTRTPRRQPHTRPPSPHTPPLYPLPPYPARR